MQALSTRERHYLGAFSVTVKTSRTFVSSSTSHWSTATDSHAVVTSFLAVSFVNHQTEHRVWRRSWLLNTRLKLKPGAFVCFLFLLLTSSLPTLKQTCFWNLLRLVMFVQPCEALDRISILILLQTTNKSSHP